jgi:phage shock protein A
MQWLNQFSLVMRSSLTALREKVEDPERMLYQLICDMEEELEAVRASVAAAIADEIELSKQVDAAREEADRWTDRAESAFQRGDEKASRQALEQKLKADDRLKTLESGYESQRTQTGKLQKSYRDLEDKIRQARHKKTLLVARLARSESARRINQALDRAEGQSAFAEFARLERRVNRSEAMAEAYDRLEGRDPEAEELAASFDDADRREQLDKEFEDLRSRLTPESP